MKLLPGLYKAVVVGLLLAGAPPAAPAWFFDAEAHRTHDTNLPRAQRSIDILSGSFTSASLSAGNSFSLSDRDSLAGVAALRAASYDNFSGLGFVALSGTAAWKRKLGLGLYAPWVGVSATAAREDYRENIRDSIRQAATLSAGKRLGERFDGSVGFTVERRKALQRNSVVPGISGAVFDLRSRTVFVRGAYDLTERIQLLLGLSLRDGEVASSTRRNAAIFAASTAIAPDRAFGPDYVGYRLPGSTTTPSLGLSWAFSEYGSLNLVYARESTRARGGLNYTSSITSASLLYRF